MLKIKEVNDNEVFILLKFSVIISSIFSLLIILSLLISYKSEKYKNYLRQIISFYYLKNEILYHKNLISKKTYEKNLQILKKENELIRKSNIDKYTLKFLLEQIKIQENIDKEILEKLKKCY